MATDKIIGIYKITNPSGRVYIGQSVNCMQRFRAYKCSCAENQQLLRRSLLKYGWENHKFEVIHECKREELNDLEIYYINLYQSFNGEHGMNLREGGQCAPMSEAAKKLISEKSKGNQKWLGRTHKQESKDAMRVAKSGKTHSAEWNKKKGSPGGKNHVARLVLNEETGIFYECVREAAESRSMPQRNLARKLRGERRNSTPFIYA